MNKSYTTDHKDIIQINHIQQKKTVVFYQALFLQFPTSFEYKLLMVKCKKNTSVYLYLQIP